MLATENTSVCQHENVSNPVPSQRVTLTRFTSPKTLTKTYELDAQGQVSAPNVSNLVSGKADVIQFSTAEDFATILDGLNHDQAVCYGRPKFAGDNFKIMSKTKFDESGQPKGHITRTENHFKWAEGQGILMLDYDPQPGHPILSKNDFKAIIAKYIPLNEVAHVWRPSSSSFIYNEGEQLRGLRGQRLYIFVNDASDINRVGKALFNRLFLDGHGHFEISKSGATLERTTIDASVFQASRLDFAAGAHCIPPLQQIKQPTEFFEGAYFDTSTILDLEPAEAAELGAMQSRIKVGLQSEIQKVRAKCAERHAVKNLAHQGIATPTIEQLSEAQKSAARALESSILTGDFVIKLHDGSQASVGTLLDNPSKYHGQTTKDPLEPDYDGGRTVGKLYLYNGRPILHSQAHGGRSYKLIRQPREIEIVKGQTVETTEKCAALLRSLPDFFDLGDALCTVENGRAKVLSNDFLLTHYVGSVAQFYTHKVDKNGSANKELFDPPTKVIATLQAMGAGRSLKPLNAVINCSTITPQGHIIDQIGYDHKSSLYLSMDGDNQPLPVPEIVTESDVKEAVTRLMHPFQEFPFDSLTDKSVCLSAILTAVCRPTLETAPAFAFDAPMKGSGKTFLAQCISFIATGEVAPAMASVEKNEDEIRKRLFASLLAGNRVIFWDNVMGALNSGTMAAMLTSSEMQERILGKSENMKAPNRALFLISGNNFCAAGELPRRILISRIDAKVENTLNRVFTLRPLDYIKAKRHELVRDALIIIRGYFQSEAYANGGVTKEKLASFEDWDTTCRQPVAWLAELMSDQFTDPKVAIDKNMTIDPEQATLGEALHLLNEIVGGEWFTAKELLKILQSVSGPNYQKREELRELLVDVIGKGLSTRSLGYFLANRKGRIVDDLKIEILEDAKRGHKFRVSAG